MSDPASNASADSDSASKRRWYRRPWVLLSLAGLAVLTSIPFAVRGYQLSLIPDIPDPFADLPPLPSAVTTTARDPLVDRYLQSRQRCVDWDNWIEADEPSSREYEQFAGELRAAGESGLAGATPGIRRFYHDNAAVIEEWFAALERVADKSIADRSTTIDALTDDCVFDLLRITAIERLQQGDSEECLSLYLQAATSLDRIELNHTWEWSQIWFFRVIVWKAIVKLAECPEIDSRLLRQALTTLKSLSGTADDVRLRLFQLEYHEEIDYQRDPDFVWISADYLSVPSSAGTLAAYILGEPELSERILRHIYAGYRSQVLLDRFERLPTGGLTVDFN